VTSWNDLEEYPRRKRKLRNNAPYMFNTGLRDTELLCIGREIGELREKKKVTREKCLTRS